MKVTKMAEMLNISFPSSQQTNTACSLPNGSLPPKGHVNPFEDPNLNITGKSPSETQKTIHVDEKVADKLRNLIREDFVKRNGMCGMGAQADAQANIIKRYTAKLPGSQKLAAISSCEQIAMDEADRLSAEIKKSNPNWQYGQPFDTSLLDNIPSKGLDVLI